MNRINLNNYEAYLLDYHDGNLSEDLCLELSLFAVQHPHLEIDLEKTVLPSLKPEKTDTDLRIHLKKTELNFPDESLINYVENNLPESELKAIESKLLTDKDLAKDLQLYKKTILIADAGLVYDRKQDLKKSEEQFELNNQVLAYFENRMSRSERSEFEKDLQADTVLQAELLLFSKTRLIADQGVTYPDKKELKKEGRIITIFNIRAIAAIAAAVLLLLVLGYVFGDLTGANARKKDMAKKDQPAGIKGTDPIKERKKAVVNRFVAESQSNGSQVRRTVAKTKAPGEQVLPEKVEKNEKQLAENKSPGDKTADAPKELDNQPERAVVVSQDSSINKQNADALAAGLGENLQTLSMLAEESDDDQDEIADSRKGFWKKAVGIARRANRLGVKSVDGVEQPNHRFSLSFNSFSVERR